MTAIEKMTGFVPGQRVEWRNGDEISTGTLVEPDNGLGGPWWLVDLDAGKQTLVKTWALFPAGGIRLTDTADAIHGVMRRLAHERGGITEPFPAWSDAYACAEAVVSMDGAA